jgi:phosphomannomutase
MPLIKSISGIRGTIGEIEGEDLTTNDIVKFTSSFVTILVKNKKINSRRIVVGRDARISGPMVEKIVVDTLVNFGIDVICLGLSTTPTVEIAVTEENADAGIIITASHNPKNWNALKLLNEKGEFINAIEGKELIKVSESKKFIKVQEKKGDVFFKNDYISRHINKILDLNCIEVDLIKKKRFKIVVDAVNSTGGIAIPMLLDKLNVECIKIYCDPNGEFPHNPEPLPENITELSKSVVKNNADLGIVTDPDVDRLAFVCEDGLVFGEEYTLVACSDYYLGLYKGPTVSNLSSSRALREVTNSHGCEHFFSAVGEVNVVELMKSKNAVIGGEGNGGVILPELHYGRDALVGIALFLSQLAKQNIRVSQLRKSYPNYYISKRKILIDENIDFDKLINSISNKYSNEMISNIDGLKIDFKNSWVQLRKSNTEPIIRVYAEAKSKVKAEELSEKFIKEIKG